MKPAQEGVTLGRYRIIEQIGAGGMAAISGGIYLITMPSDEQDYDSPSSPTVGAAAVVARPAHTDHWVCVCVCRLSLSLCLSVALECV